MMNWDLPTINMRPKIRWSWWVFPNGLRDIVPHIGADFTAYLGIGHQATSQKYHLCFGKPTSDEQIALDLMLDAAMQNLPALINGDIAKHNKPSTALSCPINGNMNGSAASLLEIFRFLVKNWQKTWILQGFYFISVLLIGHFANLFKPILSANR